MKRVLPLLLATGVILGQEAPPPPDPPQRERMDMMRMWRMTEFLNLSEEQAQKFFPRYNALTSDLEEMSQKQRELMKELRESVKEGKVVKEKEVDETMAELIGIEKQKLDKEKAFVEEIGNVLTSEQKAKYVVFEAHFREELRERIRERYVPHSKREGLQPGRKWRK